MHSRVEVLPSSSSSSSSAFSSCSSFHSTSPSSPASSESSSLSSSFTSLSSLNQLNVKNSDEQMSENKLNIHDNNQEEEKEDLFDDCLPHDDNNNTNKSSSVTNAKEQCDVDEQVNKESEKHTFDNDDIQIKTCNSYNNNNVLTSTDKIQKVSSENSSKYNNHVVETEEVNVTDENNRDNYHSDATSSSSNNSSNNNSESVIDNKENRINLNEPNEVNDKINDDKEEDDDDDDDDDDYSNDDEHEVDVEECARLKVEGNELFAAGDVDGALCKYRQAIAKAEIKPFRSPQTTSNMPSSLKTKNINDDNNKNNNAYAEDDDEMHNYTLTAQVFCNAGYCLMKLGETKDAEPMLSEAIRHQPNYLKALLRRADCYYCLEKWSSAFGDFESYEKHGGVLSINDQQRKTIAKGKMDAEMQKMLGELKDLGNKFLGNFGLSTDNFKFDKDPKTGGYSMRFEREKILV